MAVTTGGRPQHDDIGSSASSALPAKRRIFGGSSSSNNIGIATTPKTAGIFKASPVTTPSSSSSHAPASGVPSSVRARVLGYSTPSSRDGSGIAVAARSPSPSHQSPVASASGSYRTPPGTTASGLPGSASTSTRSLDQQAAAQRRVRAASTEVAHESPSSSYTANGAGRAVRAPVTNVNNKPASATPPLSPGSKRAKAVFPSSAISGNARVNLASALGSPANAGGNLAAPSQVRARAQSQAPLVNGQRTLKASVSQTNLASLGKPTSDGHVGLLPSPTLSGSSGSSSSSHAPFANARSRLKSLVSASVPTAAVGLGVSTSQSPSGVFARSAQKPASSDSPLSRPASPVRAATVISGTSEPRRPASPIRARTVPSTSLAASSSRRPASPVRQPLPGPSTPKTTLPSIAAARPRSPFKPSPATPRRPTALSPSLPLATQASTVSSVDQDLQRGHSHTISSVSSSSTIPAPAPATSSPPEPPDVEADSSISVASSSSDEEGEDAALSYAFSSSGVSSSTSALSSTSTAATSARDAASPPLSVVDAKSLAVSADTPVASRYQPRTEPMRIGESSSPKQSSPLGGVSAPGLPSFEQATSAALADKEAMEKEHRDAKVRRKILDLEITNKSLLAINATLERTKLSQATELRDLRRAVREGHFSSSSTLPLHTAPLLRSSEYSPLKSPEVGYFQEEEDEMPWDEVLSKDPGFGDVVRALETLHVRALQALQKTSSAAAGEVGGKVLSQFALEQQSRHPAVALQRPPLSPGKGSRRRGRTVSLGGGTAEEATPRVKQGFSHPLPEAEESGFTPDVTMSTDVSSTAGDETASSAATGTEDEESLSSSAYLDEASIDDRSRTSTAYTAEMSLGVD